MKLVSMFITASAGYVRGLTANITIFPNYLHSNSHIIC